MTIRQALRKAKRCYIHTSFAAHPASPCLPVAKYTIQALIDQGWNGDDETIASWSLEASGSLHVHLAN